MMDTQSKITQNNDLKSALASFRPIREKVKNWRNLPQSKIEAYHVYFERLFLKWLRENNGLSKTIIMYLLRNTYGSNSNASIQYCTMIFDKVIMETYSDDIKDYRVYTVMQEHTLQ